MADQPNNFDEAVLAVQNGEILTITRECREVAVLMGVDMYDALKAKLGLADEADRG